MTDVMVDTLKQASSVELLYDSIQADMHRFKSAISKPFMTVEMYADALQHARKLQAKLDEAIAMLEQRMNVQ